MQISHDFDSLLFTDLLSGMRKFNGSYNYFVSNFFDGLEKKLSFFYLFQMLKKIIDLKLLLVERVKLFMQSQQHLLTNSVFKETLINGFSDKLSALEIHKSLQSHKLRQTQSLQGYFFCERNYH